MGERGPGQIAVIVWALESGRVVAEFKGRKGKAGATHGHSPGHRHGVGALAWSPDNALLVSVGFRLDGQVLGWRLNTLPIGVSRS